MTNASSRSTFALLGIGAGLAVGAAAAVQSNRAAVARKVPATGGQVGGGSGNVITTPSKPTTPTPVPSTGTPGSGFGFGIGSSWGAVPVIGGALSPIPAAPTVGSVPAGPSWAGDPPVNASNLLDKRSDALAAFLAKAQPLYWGASPIARRRFASELVTAAYWEKYPLDLLVGHCWAEGALKPYMTPTAGSGAYGPLQVTAIACADVGMSYPPRTVQEAVTVGIRLLRLHARRHSEAAGSINNALRIYGLGYSGFQQFQKYGCSGKPCDRPQSVWRHECGCSGASNRYTWKVREMAGKAAAAGLHTHSWAAWRVKA